MKKHGIFFLLLLLISSIVSAQATKPDAIYKKWRIHNHTVDAKVLALDKGMVALELPNGNIRTLPFAAFSESNQSKLRSSVTNGNVRYATTVPSSGPHIPILILGLALFFIATSALFVTKKQQRWTLPVITFGILLTVLSLKNDSSIPENVSKHNKLFSIFTSSLN